jgi:hypothetical protein
MHGEKTESGRAKRVLLIAFGAIACALLGSVVTVVALGGGSGLWSNCKDFTRSLHEEIVVKQLTRMRVESAEARGRREAKGDLARGDLRIKALGLQPPWFEAYQKTVINSYGVGLDQGGCVVDDEKVAYTRAYNEESMKVIAEKVGEDKLDAAYHQAEADWKAKNGRAETK